VENLPAGAGNVGTAAAARAQADGYAAVVVTSSFWINPGLYAKLPYDPIRARWAKVIELAKLKAID